MYYVNCKDITCYKEPTFTINRNNYGTNEDKAILISKETGIPIEYIFDKSKCFLYQDKICYYLDRTENWLKKDNIWYFVKEQLDSFSLFNI